MKNLLILIIASLAIASVACSENETVLVQPQTTQINETDALLNRNLRPATGEKPDLKVFPFFVSGSVTLASGYYKIPISFKELNIGTANDTGANMDSLKVYQKIPLPFGGFYSYRYLTTYIRPTNIPMGATWYLNAIVNFPAKWRPASGKINLVIKADDYNVIAELNETNNLSDTVWNIYLP